MLNLVSNALPHADSYKDFLGPGSQNENKQISSFSDHYERDYSNTSEARNKNIPEDRLPEDDV